MDVQESAGLQRARRREHVRRYRLRIFAPVWSAVSGFAPSANLGDKYAVFEPTHGSAPKYAGQYKVNPHRHAFDGSSSCSTGSAKPAATQLENAIARVIKEGKVRTYDMGGNASTLDMAKAIADYASS